MKYVYAVLGAWLWSFNAYAGPAINVGDFYEIGRAHV